MFKRRKVVYRIDGGLIVGTPVAMGNGMVTILLHKMANSKRTIRLKPVKPVVVS